MKHQIDNFPHIQGSQLDLADRNHVLSAFVHRFTMDHKPAWANKPMPNGKAYQVQFASDNEWLENTRFAMNAQGKLNRFCRECRSLPTWPTAQK